MGDKRARTAMVAVELVKGVRAVASHKMERIAAKAVVERTVARVQAQALVRLDEKSVVGGRQQTELLPHRSVALGHVRPVGWGRDRDGEHLFPMLDNVNHMPLLLRGQCVRSKGFVLFMRMHERVFDLVCVQVYVRRRGRSYPCIPTHANTPISDPR